jgi:hypothetical protein
MRMIKRQARRRRDSNVADAKKVLTWRIEWHAHRGAKSKLKNTIALESYQVGKSRLIRQSDCRLESAD